MDDTVAKLERARAATPDDVGVVVDLARAYVRAGRPLRALAVLGPRDPAEREDAGRAFAAARGLEWVGVVEGADHFRAGGDVLVLVHGGAFCPPDDEDGHGLARPVPRGDVDVGPFLAGLTTREAAYDQTRLPTVWQWLKLWRGGRHLDGDLSRRVPNPNPTRMLPHGPSFGTGPTPSPYGATFDTHAAELLQGSRLGVFHTSSGRYVLRDRPSSAVPFRRVIDLAAEA